MVGPQQRGRLALGRRGPELGEGPQRRGQLAGRGVRVAQLAQGPPHQDARPRRLVRHLQVPPHAQRPAERGHRRAGVARGQQRAPPRLVGHGPHGRAAEGRGDAVQLVGGRDRLVDRVDSQQYLHGTRQQPGPADRVARLGQQPPDGTDGRLRTSPRQPQQGQAGLRLETEADRPVVRRLGGTEVTNDPQHVAALAHGQPRGRGRPGRVVPLGREPELLDRRGEGAADAHDLPAVHRALAGERDQSRLGVDPGGQRAGPLGRPAVVGDLLAGLDQRAVDLAGDDRRHVAGRDADHRLVQQGEPLRDVAGVDQHPALGVEAVGRQVGVTETAAVVGHLLGEPVGLAGARRRRCG